MPQINNLNQQFIGIVKSYDAKLRTVEVFVPKLMPTIPENREPVKTITNLSNNNIDLLYSTNITQCSTITARAFDMNEPMPEIESRVIIQPIEGMSYEFFWYKWNVNGDYEVIEAEKYPKHFSLNINDRKIDVSLSDDIEIKFPDAREVMLFTDPENPKKRTFEIRLDDETDDDLTELYNIVGIPGGEYTYTDSNGIDRTAELNPTGIFKLINDRTDTINSKITELEGLLNEDSLKLLNLIKSNENSIIDTVEEVFNVFENYNEGANLVEALSNKVDIDSGIASNITLKKVTSITTEDGDTDPIIFDFNKENTGIHLDNLGNVVMQNGLYWSVTDSSKNKGFKVDTETGALRAIGLYTPELPEDFITKKYADTKVDKLNGSATNLTVSNLVVNVLDTPESHGVTLNEFGSIILKKDAYAWIVRNYSCNTELKYYSKPTDTDIERGIVEGDFEISGDGHFVDVKGPTKESHLVNKEYVDAQVAAINEKISAIESKINKILERLAEGGL